MKKTKSKYQEALADFDAAREATETHVMRAEAIQDRIAARWDPHNADPFDLVMEKPFEPAP